MGRVLRFPVDPKTQPLRGLSMTESRKPSYLELAKEALAEFQWKEQVDREVMDWLDSTRDDDYPSA